MRYVHRLFDDQPSAFLPTPLHQSRTCYSLRPIVAGFLAVLAAASSWTTLDTVASAQVPSGSPNLLPPTFQSVHAASTSLVPQYVLLTIPVSAVNAEADIAVNELRQRRTAVEQASIAMGCETDQVHPVLFSVGKPTQRSVALRGNQPTGPQLFRASCFVFALSPLEYADREPEDLILEAQQKLQQITAVLPDAEPESNSYRIQTYSSSTEIVDPSQPGFLFAAASTKEQRRTSLQLAIAHAREQADLLAEDLDTEPNGQIRINVMPSRSPFSISTKRSPTSVLVQRYPDLVFGKYPDALAVESRVTVMSAK